MSSKESSPAVRKPTKKIADSRRMRYGAGNAPARRALARRGDAGLGQDPFRLRVTARRASGSRRTAMTETPQPNPAVTFYGAIPGCRAPMRADPRYSGRCPRAASSTAKPCERLRPSAGTCFHRSISRCSGMDRR